MKSNPHAVFHGGPDGGHFFELIEWDENKYRFKIYMDYNEKLYIEGYFNKVLDSCKFDFNDKNIHDFISYYNYNVIYLDHEKKRCKLRLTELIYEW